MANATIQLLDRLALSIGGESKASDYRLARTYFEVSQQKVSGWRTGKMSFSDERVLQVCETIWPGDDDQKAHWLARVHADREQNAQLKALWQRIAQRALAACIALVVGFAAPAPNQAAATAHNGENIYYAQSRRRRRWRWFCTWLPILALAGCANTPAHWQTEAAWQALHTVDTLQTYHGPTQPCRHEEDPLTARVIGRNPSRGQVVAWGVGAAAAHAGVTWLLVRADAPRWLVHGWGAVTLVAVGATVVHNEHVGNTALGEADCPGWDL